MKLKLNVTKLTNEDAISTSGAPTFILSGSGDSVSGNLKFYGNEGEATNSTEFNNLYKDIKFYQPDGYYNANGSNIFNFDNNGTPLIEYDGEYVWDQSLNSGNGGYKLK